MITRLTAWFYRLLRNALVDHYRTRGASRRREEAFATLVESLGEDVVPDGWAAQLCTCLGSVVDTLKPQQAELLRRVDLNGEPVQSAARALKLVANAQRSRAPIHELADKVAGIFVPAVVVIAALTFGLWYFFGPEPRLAYVIVNAVAVLIIACPCALGLATPMAIMVGVGRVAQAGILVKNAEALKHLGKVTSLVVDKTGTLTEGKPQLTDVIPVAGASEPELLRLAAALERASEHPVGSGGGAGSRDPKDRPPRGNRLSVRHRRRRRRNGERPAGARGQGEVPVG